MGVFNRLLQIIQAIFWIKKDSPGCSSNYVKAANISIDFNQI